MSLEFSSGEKPHEGDLEPKNSKHKKWYTSASLPPMLICRIVGFPYPTCISLFKNCLLSLLCFQVRQPSVPAPDWTDTNYPEANILSQKDLYPQSKYIIFVLKLHL